MRMMRDQRNRSASSFEDQRASRLFESCHCAGRFRPMRVLTEPHQGEETRVRIEHAAPPERGTRVSQVFCSRNTASGVSHGRVYARSQLSRPSRPSRPSFSSRSNNNNHSLFAYITPFSLPPRQPPPRTAVRIKFP